MYALYSFVLTLALAAWAPALFLRPPRGDRREAWRERLGAFSGALATRLRGLRPVWLHAVSVGEVAAASVLGAALAEHRSDLSLLVSTVTPTGRAVAGRMLPQAAAVIYFPLDLPGIVGRALATVGPRVVLLTETELWPNFLRACEASRIPVAVVNGRISGRSFRRYRLVRPFLRQVLRAIGLFCMQSQADAERVLALGASPDRVHVVGNLKFDMSPRGDGSALVEVWRRELRIDPRRPVVVAGSTHQGEEQALLLAYRRLRQEFPDLLLVLAPRHPERLREVEAEIARAGLAVARRSAIGETAGAPKDVLLVDTVGELATLYALGTVAFVGGSLVPKGGHNLLEPALYARPIVFGPHMENFADASRLFLERGAAVQVGGDEELTGQLRALLGDPAARARMGLAAVEVLSAHRGACQRTLALLERLL
jgi:3-deoxy-D-manno-octulosonic-acid transferase